MMQVVRTKQALVHQIGLWKKEGLSIGFVPTMGALHEGHLSLVRQSVRENRYTVVSIFVNPTQFNNSTDFVQYPRDESGDLQLLNSSKADVIFIPDEGEMYQSAVSELLDFDMEGLDQTMEGKFRPGHFTGVVTIVDKLFQLIAPNQVYLGQKDFQQVAIIRLLAARRYPDIHIVACPIIREASGLAMSSRNRLLTAEEMRRAAIISQALFTMRNEFTKKPLKQLLEEALQILHSAGEPEYLEVVNPDTLKPANSLPVVICTAVRIGKVRLIDNIEVS